MKFGFYVSGRATRLKRLLRLMKDSSYHYMLTDIMFVYNDSEADNDLIQFCKAVNIELIEGNVEGVGGRECSAIVSEDLFKSMVKYKADVLLVFGSNILRGKLLEAFSSKIINFHPSLLPAFPGLKSLDQALANGSFLTGNTAHFVDEGVDTGPVIMQQISVIGEWKEYDVVLDRQIPMCIQLMKWFEDGRVRVDGRNVRVKDAKYSLSEYIPNLEIKLGI